MRNLALVLLLACDRRPADSAPSVPDTPPPTAPTDSEDPTTESGAPVTPAGPDDPGSDALRVAIIGDFGSGDTNEAAVAELVATLDPDLVLTMGDNNYPSGSADTIDANVGQFYAAFIHPYAGAYGTGGSVNRFWPSVGNHDWQLGTLDPYLEYFELPHNERYYSVDHGVLATFAIDSDPHEPDGISASSVQATWLRDALAASTATWKLVYMHHPPFSSGTHGDNSYMWWPWGAWGADFVWGGHDHDYEAIERHGVIYGINGIGGTSLRSIYAEPVEGSFAAFTAAHGATLATFTDTDARFLTLDVNGNVVDDFRLLADRPLSTSAPLIHQHATWRFLDTGFPPPASWTQPGFDDAFWREGPAPLGYGSGDEATAVGYGGDPLDKHVTTWFRHTFTVDDVETWDALELGLIADDGAVVYLNGVEIHRAGLPAGVVGPDTLATAEATVDSFVEVALGAEHLVQGDNVLAVEVHLASASSSDMAFDLWLDARQDDRLLPFGSAWRYDDDGATPADWASPTFDDADWSVGAAPLGFGGAVPVATEIDVGGDPAARKATTWYRHAFEIEDASAIDALLMELVRADGAVVYLNGTQLYRSNVPEGVALTAETHAGSEVLEKWADRPVRSFLDPALLVDGTNVVAVAVRVASPDAEVHRFDLALTAFP